MLPPFVMDKTKAPKVKAKRAAAKPKAEKEPKSSTAAATAAAAKAQKAAADGAGLYRCVKVILHVCVWERGDGRLAGVEWGA